MSWASRRLRHPPLARQIWSQAWQGQDRPLDVSGGGSLTPPALQSQLPLRRGRRGPLPRGSAAMRAPETAKDRSRRGRPPPTLPEERRPRRHPRMRPARRIPTRASCSRPSRRRRRATRLGLGPTPPPIPQGTPPAGRRRPPPSRIGAIPRGSFPTRPWHPRADRGRIGGGRGSFILKALVFHHREVGTAKPLRTPRFAF